MNKTVTVELNGHSYVWNGRSWFASRTFHAPPTILVSKLNDLLASVLTDEDSQVQDYQSLLRIARTAREAAQFKRAEAAARRAIALDPHSEPAYCILCSVLRSLGASDRAVQETDHLPSATYSPLLVSRAAAFCDLGRWEEAKATIGRALALGQSQEAFEVMRRIKAHRPDLYERRK